LEREDMVVSFNRLEPSLALRNQVIKPLYESKSMQDIFRDLGKKLSVPLFEVSAKHDEELQESIKESSKLDAFEDGGYNLAELYKYDIQTRNKKLIVKHFGEDVYKTLKQKGVWHPYIDTQKELYNNYYEYYPHTKRYYTVDRKYKVKCYLKKLAKEGFDAMPSWNESYDFKVKHGKFRMITGRYITSTQTATTNNKMLRDIQKTNHLWLNDKIAEKLDIKEGDDISVSSSISKVILKAYPTNKIHPQVVWFAHGFGSQSKELTNSFGTGASDNQIIEDSFEKIYGCATMHHTDVEIRKI
jgi:thiosulfate reductase/polysulfide reductase chain A